jgi:hypothetical protein
LPSFADHPLKNEENVTSSKMVRSSTDYSLQSLKSESFSSVFSSSISKFNENPQEEVNADTGTNLLVTRRDLNNNSSNVNKQKKSLRYDFNFLLARSSVPSSKLMPQSWKHLNEKYPEVCFCGKVISYFDHLKYYSHLNQVKKLNQNRSKQSVVSPNQKTNSAWSDHNHSNYNNPHFFPKRDLNHHNEKNLQNKSHDFNNNNAKKDQKSFDCSNADLSSSSNSRKFHQQPSYAFNGFKREPVKTHFQNGYSNSHNRNLSNNFE